MRVFHHPNRNHPGPEAEDLVLWAFVAAVAGANALLMWSIATGGV